MFENIKYQLNKIKIFIIILFFFILTIYFWIYEIYINIKYAKITEPVEIEIIGLNKVEYESIRIFREAPKSGIHEIKKINDIIKIENCYIKNLYLGLTDDIKNNINGIAIIIGTKNYKYNKFEIKNFETINNNEFNIKNINFYKLIDGKNFNNSRIKYFKNIINWPGDFIIIFKSFNISVLLKIILMFIPICFFITIFKLELKNINKKKIIICLLVNIFLLILLIFLKFNKIILYFSFVISALFTFLNIFNYKILNFKFKLLKFNKINFLLLLVMILGFSLRVYKLNHGLPFTAIDEDNIADAPVLIISNNTLYPHNFQRPNHVSIYLNTIIYDFVSYLRYHKSLAFTFNNNKPFYYLISRFLVVFTGILSILLIYLIGKEFNKIIAIFSSLIYALFPSYISHSHFINPDILLTFFILCVMYFSIKFIKYYDVKYLIYSSIFAGFATVEKYPGSLCVLMIIYCIIFLNYKDKKKLFYFSFLSFSTFILSIFIISPFLILDTFSVMNALIFEATVPLPGAYGFGYYGNVAYYIKANIKELSLLLVFIIICGFFNILKNHLKYFFIILFGIIYLLLLSKLSLHVERWAIPMYISSILLSGFGLFFLFEIITKLITKFRILIIIVIFLYIGIILTNLLLKDVNILVNFPLKDTRIITYNFMKENNINITNSIATRRGPFLEAGTLVFEKFMINYNNKDFMSNKKYIVLSSSVYNIYISFKDRFVEKYIFINNIFKLQLLYKIEPKIIPYYFNNFFEWENISKIKNFISYYKNNKNNLYNGPEIRIYKYQN